MNAVVEGRVRLDAPVNDYLPPELEIPSEGFSEPILVRHLLTHSPGFEDRALGELFVADPSRIRPLSVFLAEARPARVYEPGRVVTYSNYGVGLAGAIVAAVEGAPWQALVEDRILRPLGVTHIAVREPYPPADALPAPLPESLAEDLSEGFRWTGLEHAPRSFDYITQIAPAGVMSASSSDMARYMLMLLGEGEVDDARIFGPEVAAAFRTPMTSFPASVGALNAGFFEFALPGGYRGYGHDGATLSFFTNMTLVPELDLGIFVATNTEGGARLSGGLPARIVEHFYGDPEVVPAAGTLDVAEARRVYAGRYLPTRRAHGGLEGFIGRLRTLNVDASPSGYFVLSGIVPEPVRMVPADEPDVFRPADVEAAGLALAFERENDRAVRVLSVAMAFERVGGLFEPRTLAVAAALAVLTAVATLIGFFVRLAHRAPARAVQRLGGGLQVSAALAWLVSLGAFAAWAARATDVARIFYDWPGALLLTATWAAVVAAGLTAAMLLVWPFALLTSSGAAWSRWRKLRFTATLAVFAAFALVLGLWGALQPWLE